jgi:hypothetical protein
MRNHFSFLVHSTHIYLPMKMEQCSETSAYKLQTPGNYPKEIMQHVWCCLDILVLCYLEFSFCAYSTFPAGFRFSRPSLTQLVFCLHSCLFLSLLWKHFTWFQESECLSELYGVGKLIPYSIYSLICPFLYRLLYRIWHCAVLTV